jgi:purine-cytosine permease-like protein
MSTPESTVGPPQQRGAEQPPVVAEVPEGRRRSYGAWVRNATYEDYSLRYAPRSFRTWSGYTVATTALGGIAYMADFSIGASIAVGQGFTNAALAITAAAVIIFLTGMPIAYYSARYGIDMDLLTRGSGFGYLGSTLTSVIYASFTFIFFALEGSIMAQAFTLGFGMPLWLGYAVASLIVLPLVVFGMTALSKLQVWTQPVWLTLMFLPFIVILAKEPSAYRSFTHLVGDSGTSHFTAIGFGTGAGVALSLIAQIGEQVDYLRFMPEKTPANSRSWWFCVMAAGPGWVVLGALKQIGGAFLAFYVLTKVGKTQALEPVQEYLGGFKALLPSGALALAVFFVVLSQIKINVTNAYSGSLSWSNFFSRLLHVHPGRVVWIFFNVGISLTLMEVGVFSFLNKVLGFYSNVAIAWIGAVVADLVINKPLGLSPKGAEFKRAHLRNFNPVGFGSMVVASLISILAYFSAFGPTLKAFSTFLAMGIAFVLSPIVAFATQGRYYVARADAMPEPLHMPDGTLSVVEHDCGVCGDTFERPDLAHCPFHDATICSLCCSLEQACHDSCKTSNLLQISQAPAHT